MNNTYQEWKLATLQVETAKPTRVAAMAAKAAAAKQASAEAEEVGSTNNT